LNLEPSLSEIIEELQKNIHKKDWEEIVFCGYGEPTERLDDLLKVTTWIRKNFEKPVKIRIDTNGHGYLINKDRDIVKELKKAGVNKICVSLNTQDKESYQNICKPKYPEAYKAIINFIKRAREELEVEVTAVNVPEVDLAKIKDLTEKMNVKLRIREYIPPSSSLSK
jgi:TatD family-associated radical SAM protein